MESQWGYEEMEARKREMRIAAGILNSERTSQLWKVFNTSRNNFSFVHYSKFFEKLSNIVSYHNTSIQDKLTSSDSNNHDKEFQKQR